MNRPSTVASWTDQRRFIAERVATPQGLQSREHHGGSDRRAREQAGETHGFRAQIAELRAAADEVRRSVPARRERVRTLAAQVRKRRRAQLCCRGASTA